MLIWFVCYLSETNDPSWSPSLLLYSPPLLTQFEAKRFQIGICFWSKFFKMFWGSYRTILYPCIGRVTLNLSDRENCFWRAGQNVWQAFNALSDILRPCHTFFPSRQLVNISSLLISLATHFMCIDSCWTKCPARYELSAGHQQKYAGHFVQQESIHIKCPACPAYFAITETYKISTFLVLQNVTIWLGTRQQITSYIVTGNTTIL